MTLVLSDDLCTARERDESSKGLKTSSISGFTDILQFRLGRNSIKSNKISKEGGLVALRETFLLTRDGEGALGPLAVTQNPTLGLQGR